MDMSDATEGAPFWQLHIAAWQHTHTHTHDHSFGRRKTWQHTSRCC